MIGRRSLVVALVLVSVGLTVGGCGGSDGGSSAVSSSGRRYTADERGAEEAVMAEIRKHCVQGSDGWTTAAWEGTSFAPVEYLREYRKLEVADVEPGKLSESDKLNGFDWVGKVTFEQTPIREAGDRGLVGGGNSNPSVWRGKGRWSQWVSYTPSEIEVGRLHGKWQFSSEGMATPITGRIPTPADHAKAGVK